jgi:rhamnosyltransferase
MDSRLTIGVVIPTYNAGKVWKYVVSALQEQRDDFDKILIIDSSSTDDTVQIAKDAEFDVVSILPSEFNHGATRNLGLRQLACDITVFLSQDVILTPHAISTITTVFNDPSVAVVYGRQIPHDDATPIACHARMFSYKPYNYVYEMEDKKKHGLKTVFVSNSFSAYRTTIFLQLGGFPHKIIFGEDITFTAKALLSGYRISYMADAIAKHSHNYSPIEVFQRAFDSGVFLRSESWIKQAFGKPDAEGIPFIVSEFLFLVKNKNILWIPYAFANNMSRMVGYKLGSIYHILPTKLIKKVSMCKTYWK